ncbi:MAG TPA: YbaB/EbfC family nucleoid-associated protein, partial [Phytomonospora sp.]
MSNPVDGSGLDRMLAQTMSALRDFQKAQGEGEPAEGTAQSDDGTITAKVTAPGRLAELRLDPRAVRYGADVLGTEIADVVNRALDDLREKTLGGGGQADFGALGEKLREIQETS